MNLARGLAAVGDNVSCFSYTRREESREITSRAEDGHLAITRLGYAFWRYHHTNVILPRLNRVSEEVAAVLGRPIEIWHLHHPSSLVIATSLALRLRSGSPLVFTTHDPLFAAGWRPVISVRRVGLLREANWREWPELALRCLPYNLADKIISLSNHERELLLRSGFSPQKVAVIPHGVRRIQQVRGIREMLGLEDKFLILTVARFVKQKGHKYLIRAMPTVLKHADAHFLMIGTETALLPELISEARKFKVDGRITFLTSVSNEDLARAYNDCDIFVLPSLYESFGLVLLEAMSCGKPVVAFESGSTSEIINQMKDGIVVPRGDSDELAKAILLLAGNRSLRDSMGSAASSKVSERFAWPLIVSKTREVYEEALRR
ncbi:MAG: glycosyltransferase family 4 protein [Nitrososphaerales archaeon]|nr:glycosyltransferase family 4 protein [Nitrososphaerales archaeon]